MPAQRVEALGLVAGCLSMPVGAGGDANETLRRWSSLDTRWRPLACLSGTAPQPIMQPRQLWDRLWAWKEGPKEDVGTLDGFAGVKLTPPVSGVPGAAMLAEIAHRRLPVLIHSGVMCPPGWIEQHVLPKLTGPVILAHLGSWPCAAELLKEAVDLAGRDERVHLETSGAAIGNFIAYAAERVPHKLLFGSNTPMCPVSVQWGHVAASIRDDATLERIAHRNAEEIFGEVTT